MNVTAFRREEVLNAFKTILPTEAKQALREASFTTLDLLDDETFSKVLKETREARHDDLLLAPLRQQPYQPAGRASSSYHSVLDIII